MTKYPLMFASVLLNGFLALPGLSFGQGVDPLTRGITVPPPSGRSCSAVPVTETGQALTDVIKKLETDVQRDTRLLRNLDRRFKMNNRELERLGATACQQHSDLIKKGLTDILNFGLDELKTAAASTQSVRVAAMLNEQNRPAIVNSLRIQINSGNEHVAAEAAAVLRMIEDGALNAATPRQMDLFIKGLETVYKSGLAATPALFDCPDNEDDPKWDPRGKALAAGLRSILGHMSPAGKLLEPLIDEDNYLAAITYFTTRNRIEQWTELNDTQLDEWKAHTCNLQRHTKTLRDARLKARPVSTTTNARNTPTRTGGSGRKIGTIATTTVALAGGAYALKVYKDTQAENAALLEDISRLPTTTTTTTTTTTPTTSSSGGDYSATVTRSCTLGPGNTNPLSASYQENCTNAPVIGTVCTATSFTFTVTGSSVRDCGGWLANAQVSGNTLTALYTGVCGSGGITVQGTLGSTLSGSGTCRGNSYTVSVTTTRR